MISSDRMLDCKRSAVSLLLLLLPFSLFAAGPVNPNPYSTPARIVNSTATAPVTYHLTLSATNGTIILDPNTPDVLPGTTVTLTATPDPTYAFSGWEPGGLAYDNPITITVNSDTAIIAHFRSLNAKLHMTAGAHGSISADPEPSFFNGVQGNFGVEGTEANGDPWTMTGVFDGAPFQRSGAGCAWILNFSSGRVHTDADIYALGVWVRGDGADSAIIRGFDASNVETNTVSAPLTTFVWTYVPLNFKGIRYVQFDIVTSDGTAGYYVDDLQYSYPGEALNSEVSLTALPEPAFRLASWGGDASGSANPLTLTMTGDKTVSASFDSNPAYNTRYRSFVYDSLIVAKGAKKKNLTEWWRFQIVNTTPNPQDSVSILFKNDGKEIISADHGFTATGGKKSWMFTGGTLNPGETLTITGRSPKPKPQSIAKLWWGIVDKTPDTTGVMPSSDHSELPMPNPANVRAEMFAKAGINKGAPWIIGARSDSAKRFGWVKLSKPDEMYKSLIDKTVKHQSTGGGFDLFGGKPFLGGKSTVSPVKHDDRTFADLLTLEFNIFLSRTGITTPGFGELQLNLPGNPYHGEMVDSIAETGERMMTYYHDFAPADYAVLDSVLRKINGAFSGPLDTLSWGDSLKLTTVSALIDVPFLVPSGAAAARIAASTGNRERTDAAIPESYSLDQNYPNPFNPTTVIGLNLPVRSAVTLKVYTILGQQVAALLNGGELEAGREEIMFDASRLASGVYFYRVEAIGVEDPANRFADVKKMLLVR